MKLKAVPKAVINFVMKNHGGNWNKTTKLVNNNFSKGDSGRIFHHTELKVGLSFDSLYFSFYYKFYTAKLVPVLFDLKLH